MAYDPIKSSKQLLTPDERIAEILFGLIMVITFTGSLSIAEAGRDDVRAMLIGAIGCNIAWGVIDAVMYLMGCMAEKGRAVKTLRALRQAADEQVAHRIIAANLPPLVASIMQPDEDKSIHQRLMQLSEPVKVPRLTGDDWKAAVGVFLLVFFVTLPVALPFVFMQQTTPAMRLSNLIAVCLLFGLGFAFGRCVDRNPWLYAIAMVILGLILVGMTIMLGG
ncbi:MAG: VIT1/CCC1 transporter family protein [Phycisphaerales bacterium]|nr:VIT1/CCC1 transporter family protein [Phycisphaerales bacterium]